MNAVYHQFIILYPLYVLTLDYLVDTSRSQLLFTLLLIFPK